MKHPLALPWRRKASGTGVVHRGNRQPCLVREHNRLDAISEFELHQAVRDVRSPPPVAQVSGGSVLRQPTLNDAR
jgi:hypothetical protein